MSDGMPNAFAEIFREPEPSTCSILVKTTPQSDIPLVLYHVARELGKPFLYGLNYINLRDSARKLRRWYPVLSQWVSPEAVEGPWRKIPPRHKVSRERLTALEEWVVAGREGDEGFHKFHETGEQVPGANPQGPASRQPEVGRWEEPPPRQRAPEAAAEHVSILPGLETLYAFVERVSQAPALIFVDSIDALADHYGIKPTEIAGALVSDLVDRGVANQILVTEVPAASKLESLVDGIVRLIPQDNPRCLEWRMVIDRLPDGRRQSEAYTLRIEADRIRSSASDEDLASVIARGGSFFHSGLPRTFLESFGGPAGHFDRPPVTSDENAR